MSLFRVFVKQWFSGGHTVRWSTKQIVSGMLICQVEKHLTKNKNFIVFFKILCNKSLKAFITLQIIKIAAKVLSLACIVKLINKQARNPKPPLNVIPTV